jgi:hypothetical protein
MTSHMKKKKAKRYQEGGEAEDKKRGLAASNKEGSVGFFERLRMGNIDDPKSEAYKRFGAGRGKAETTKEKEAIKSYKGSANPFQGDDVDPFNAVRKPSGEIMREPAKEPAKTPAKAKPAIVTKEQLKASGFDNLRDYLNAQRGLTRRGESSPRKPAANKAAVSRGPSRGTQDEGDAGEKAARKAQEAKMAKAREMRKQTDPGDVPANVRRTQEASAKSKRRDMTGFAQMPFSKQMEYLSTKGKEGTGFKTKEGSTRKKDEMGDYTPFKKGGTVSSASKRGDGIAIRGKTRGRMV